MAWNDLDRITAEKLNAMDTGGIFADAYFITSDYNEPVVQVMGDFSKAFDKITQGIPLIAYLFLDLGSSGLQMDEIFGHFPIVTDGTYIYFPYSSVNAVKWGIHGAEFVTME